MRDALKKLVDSKNYPNEYDLSRTIWIAKNLHSGRMELAIKHQNEAANETDNEEEFMTHADDIHWYGHEESFFIWHFCLLRLQAIMEGIIVGKYLYSSNTKDLWGLKSKLDAMRKCDYKIEEKDYTELLGWAAIRNQLSHYPPSSHSPGPIDENDVIEYHNLCLRLLKSWENQKQSST